MTKIQWEGWGQFNNDKEFTAFSWSNRNNPHNEILWPTTDCPIVIWLN